MLNRRLQRSYTFLAPFYDAVLSFPTRTARQYSFDQLGNIQNARILLCGIGSGLDIPYLSQGNLYIGADVTYAMLKRAKQKILESNLNIVLHQADVTQLPYSNHCFDIVIMHLILAVVSEPQKALDEANRVLKPKGKLLIFDKFLKPNQFAPIRRFISPLIARIATRTDVVFEELQHTDLTVINDKPALLRGWFRHIVLDKK
jgi:phosphatidylethanolamine/phosphatidyl-N-methylethanolamine N-methyltransferase